MAARGVKTKVTDNDGSDFAYRQTIEDKYHHMAQLKAQIRLTQSASRPYFVAALATALTQLVLYSQHSPLLRYHPLLFNMSPLPLVCLLVLTFLITYQSFSSIQHSTSPILLYLTALLNALLAVIAIALPLSRKLPLTIVDWGVVGLHTLGLSVVAWGLYNAFRLSRLSNTKRL